MVEHSLSLLGIAASRTDAACVDGNSIACDCADRSGQAHARMAGRGWREADLEVLVIDHVEEPSPN